MACIDLQFTRTDQPLALSLSRFDTMLKADFTRVTGPVNVLLSRIDNAIDVAFSRADSPLDFTMTVVCSIENEYLRVPMKTVWLTESNGYSQDIEVYANVVWHIE